MQGVPRRPSPKGTSLFDLRSGFTVEKRKPKIFRHPTAGKAPSTEASANKRISLFRKRTEVTVKSPPLIAKETPPHSQFAYIQER